MRSKLLGVIVIVSIVAGVGLGEAQIADTRSFSPGFSLSPDDFIPLGPFSFSPAFELGLEHLDNIFYTTEKVDDLIHVARARLLFDLPIAGSNLRFMYTPQYRDYSDFELEEKWSHFLTIDGTFEFPIGLKLTPRYSFASATQETRELDPGDELLFSNQRFDKHDLGLGVNYWITNRDGVTIVGQYTDVNYPGDLDIVERQRFYDYTSTTLRIGWLHQLNPSVVVDVSYDQGRFDSDSLLGFRDSSSDGLSFGIRGELTPVLRADFRAGRRTTEYNGIPGVIEFEDFAGLVMDGSVTWSMAHGGSLRLNLLRSDFPSREAFNAGYTATGGGLTYRVNLGLITAQVLANYQVNDYKVIDPELQSLRSVDILRAGVGAFWDVRERMRLRLSYLYNQRDEKGRSDIDYRSIVLTVVAGL